MALRRLSVATLMLWLVVSIQAQSHGYGTTSIDKSTSSSEIQNQNVTQHDTPSYFRQAEYSGWMLGHIAVMSFAWIMVLPIVVMFSIAKSRYTVPAHFAFLLSNVVGVLLSTIYNSGTPDLYANNAHHKLGWVLSWLVCVQVILTLLPHGSSKEEDKSHASETAAFIPISSRAMAVHQHLQTFPEGREYRYSNDSGQGTEPNTASLAGQSTSSIDDDDCTSPLSSMLDEMTDVKSPRETHGKVAKRLLSIIEMAHVIEGATVYHGIMNRCLLMLGYLAICSGVVTYGGFFHGFEIYSGLAHFAKGSVFVWFGVLTLGRFSGCFGDRGWAWNLSPTSSPRYTAEFVESFLIFLYGSTNIFMEHLGSRDGGWSAQDLEHLAITFMFIGGGGCGMLVDWLHLRDLVNIGLLHALDDSHSAQHEHESNPCWKSPRSYSVSINPVPCLVIFLLGLLMSSHHQLSMFSSQVHHQWGSLLCGAALARGVTYIMLYVSPPVSFLPSRPPTELITTFCLLAGGFIFMASSHDTVVAMEESGLDAMFVLTVVVGIVTLLMSWMMIVIALKGWAVKREMQNSSHRPSLA